MNRCACTFRRCQCDSFAPSVICAGCELGLHVALIPDGIVDDLTRWSPLPRVRNTVERIARPSE